MRILEIIEASKGVVGETRGRSVNEVGALGVLKNLLGAEDSGVASGLEDQKMSGMPHRMVCSYSTFGNGDTDCLELVSGDAST